MGEELPHPAQVQSQGRLHEPVSFITLIWKVEDQYVLANARNIRRLYRDSCGEFFFQRPRDPMSVATSTWKPFRRSELFVCSLARQQRQRNSTAEDCHCRHRELLEGPIDSETSADYLDPGNNKISFEPADSFAKIY